MGTGATTRKLTIKSFPLTRQIAGFIDHLRLNNFSLGPAETSLALQVVSGSVLDEKRSQYQLKSLLIGCAEEWRQFDDLFEAYWHRTGKERSQWASDKSYQNKTKASLPKAWDQHFSENKGSGNNGPQVEAEGEGNTEGSASGRLIATDKTTMAKTDLRQFVDPKELLEAELLAYKLASAMRYRLSRRYRMSKLGQKLDLRRTIRRSLSTGGEPIVLCRRKRPDRPIRLVVFLDISGSMKHYSRFFLQFVKGLVCRWMEADAYLFHTKLIRVTDVVRDKNSTKAMTRLSVMAEGFGGGTKLGESLAQFNTQFAKNI
ncbi:MAG: VWA domain-containing protein [Sneathiella sp.]|nr:VWA domain-containing protein [Sneathiella sp.]